jgi:septum formation topological specificity factor MinE
MKWQIFLLWQQVEKEYLKTKYRLKLEFIHGRRNLSPRVMEKIKKELIQVIKQYVRLDAY